MLEMLEPCNQPKGDMYTVGNKSGRTEPSIPFTIQVPDTEVHNLVFARLSLCFYLIHYFPTMPLFLPFRMRMYIICQYTYMIEACNFPFDFIGGHT